MKMTTESPVKIELPQCKHFVKRKKRFCKMTVKAGLEYCGEHTPPETGNNLENTLRIVCPLDNKHTCFAHKLEKHLKICNAKPRLEKYMLRDVNSGDISSSEASAESRQLSSVDVKEIKAVITKVQKIYDEYVNGNITDNNETCEIIEEVLKSPEYGDKTRKHLIQASSILGILAKENLVKENTCYIEFGAGKGQLSYWLSELIKDQKDSSVLLVERASHRHKYDNRVDKNERKISRIKVDIADLLLHEVDAVKSTESIVSVTKHLCGGATDLALRCIRNYELNGGKVSGIAMTFCCHHRCLWSSYTGKDFLKMCGLSKTDFDIICGMVSWAICGTGLSRDKSITTSPEPSQREKELGLTREEKEVIGRKCKNVLNYGRLHYLKQFGYKCSLSLYVKASISPENICIIATK